MRYSLLIYLGFGIIVEGQSSSESCPRETITLPTMTITKYGFYIDRTTTAYTRADSRSETTSRRSSTMISQPATQSTIAISSTDVIALSTNTSADLTNSPLQTGVHANPEGLAVPQLFTTVCPSAPNILGTDQADTSTTVKPDELVSATKSDNGGVSINADVHESDENHGQCNDHASAEKQGCTSSIFSAGDSGYKKEDPIRTPAKVTETMFTGSSSKLRIQVSWLSFIAILGCV